VQLQTLDKLKEELKDQGLFVKIRSHKDERNVG